MRETINIDDLPNFTVRAILKALIGEEVVMSKLGDKLNLDITLKPKIVERKINATFVVEEEKK